MACQQGGSGEALAVILTLGQGMAAEETPRKAMATTAAARKTPRNLRSDMVLAASRTLDTEEESSSAQRGEDGRSPLDAAAAAAIATPLAASPTPAPPALFCSLLLLLLLLDMVNEEWGKWKK